MLNRIAKGILIASILIFPQTNTVDGFAIQHDKDLKEKDIKAISDLQIHEDKSFGLHKGYNNLQAKIEEHKKIQEAVQMRLEEIKIREEEKKRKEEEKNKYDIDLVFSYYTDLSEENGGYTGITCTGEPLKYGHIASNVWKLGTQFKTQDGQIFTVADKGGSHFDSWNRVDCYIPRQIGESTSQYKQRVLNMGRKTVKVKILK